ncbi:amidohydrolase family protein [Paraburkholderia xenovorans]|nr:amidohydrolase family protein [Paraburkholderia xenovorans]
MKIFDCHSHWATREAYVMRTEEELARVRHVWGTDILYLTQEEQAAYFREHQAKAILDLSFTKTLPIEEIRQFHDYALDYQRKYPDTVAGHWLQFEPHRAEESLEEFERVKSAALGFTGFCVNGQVTGVPPGDPAWFPFYERSVDHGTPVLILCGLTGIGQGLPGGKGIILDHGHPRHVDAVAARYPELKVLASRPAYPWQDEMIAVMLHKANVHYELHGWGPRQFSPALKKEIGGRMQDRIMFGCDFPALRFEKVIPDWLNEGYTEAVLSKVLFENAQRYFE